MRFTRSMKIAATAAVAVGALAGVGQAAISSDGTITTCVNSSTGAWRVVDADGPARPCNTSETPLALNQTGPAGPAGPAGAAGPAGPAGPSFVHARYITGKWSPRTEFLTAAKIEVDTGLYEVSAKGTAYMTEALGQVWATVSCALRVRQPDGDYKTLDAAAVEVSDNGPEFGSFALQGLLNVGAGTVRSVRLDCKDDGGDGGALVVLRQLRLHVRQVGGWYQKAA